MARARKPEEPTSYEGRTQTPTEIAPRVEAVKAVLGDRLSTSEAARQLGISRPNMQTLVHRAEAAVIAALTPRSTGPTPRPTRERELETELTRLRKQNAKLEQQLAAMDDMLGAAGEIIRSLRGLPPRKSPRSSKSSPQPQATSADDEDPEPPASMTLLARVVARMATMSDLGARAARALGVGTTTLRRWLGRFALGEPLLRRRGGRATPVMPAAEHAVRGLVRSLGGLPGAASLAHSVAGVSRRSAARLKQDELAVIERERQAAAASVSVLAPGIVRGFDQLYLADGLALIAADASVPYRTSAVHVPSYDAANVAAALEADFRAHGPPLVLRLDRARCHDAPAVASVLHANRVLPLHGPAHHPQYYGQHERQNREHRAWLAHHPTAGPADLTAMRMALNGLWRRPTLDWRTAEELWLARRPLDDDRNQLHDEVHERAGRLRADGVAADMAMRLAIEQALIKRGYLAITRGRRVLCE